MTVELREKITMFQQLNQSTISQLNRAGTKYIIPSITLLKKYESCSTQNTLDTGFIKKTIEDLGFKTEIVKIEHGPVITRFSLKLIDARLSQFRKITDDLATALMSGSIRIQVPIPGTTHIGIEVENKIRSCIGMQNIFPETITAKIPIVLGTDTIGNTKVLDLIDMPHLLIAGQTGSGKSVCLNSIILSILLTKTPQQCQLVMVDPKRVEMAFYKNLPHLWTPIVNDPYEALQVFSSLVDEMERRYKILEHNQIKNIEDYNKRNECQMPYIVTIVDEMADLMMCSDSSELESKIVRLAQLARAVGIHLVLATQKPIVKVITGLIKSNMPSRIAFKVTSKGDSRVILDCNGAETLAGKGDMLLSGTGIPEPLRYHGVFISDEEIKSIINFIKE